MSASESLQRIHNHVNWEHLITLLDDGLRSLQEVTDISDVFFKALKSLYERDDDRSGSLEETQRLRSTLSIMKTLVALRFTTDVHRPLEEIQILATIISKHADIEYRQMAQQFVRYCASGKLR